jgi:DNA-binding MarR family transcriptional regulator
MEGYVSRQDNPGDRRSVIIRALPGQDLVNTVDPIFASLGQAMGELARQYSEKELVAIQDFVSKTEKILREQTAKLQKDTYSGRRKP